MISAGQRPRAFTLIELLVVVAIVALLIAILIPSLARARETARKTACLSNLRQIGTAIREYAMENGGVIPFGPKAPPMISAADFYPCTGSPTSLISLMNGQPVGLGLMLSNHLAQQRRVLFCPSSDQPFDANTQLANVGTTQAQGSYYYRHGSNPNSSPSAAVPTDHIHLDSMGENRLGVRIRALAVDTNFLCPPSLASFDVRPATHHQAKAANIIFTDGHAVTQANTGGRFTVDLSDYSALLNAFDRILTVLEKADDAP